MASEISYRQYWTEIDDLAKEVKSRSEEGEDEYDILHEVVDGHEWVIYYWAHPWVLMHTENEDYYFDEFGETLEAKSYGDVTTKLAFWAMYGDVLDRMSRE